MAQQYFIPNCLASLLRSRAHISCKDCVIKPIIVSYHNPHTTYSLGHTTASSQLHNSMDDTLDPEKLQDNGEPQVTIQQQPVDTKPQASQEDEVTKHQSPLFVEEVEQGGPAPKRTIVLLATDPLRESRTVLCMSQGVTRGR